MGGVRPPLSPRGSDLGMGDRAYLPVWTGWRGASGGRVEDKLGLFLRHLLTTQNRYCPFKRQRTHPCYYGPKV